MAETRHPPVSPLRAALGARCPRCGVGRLFQGFLTVRRACAECGLDLRAHDSGDGPAVFVIFIVGALTVLAALLVEAWLAPAYWVHVAIWPVVILGLSLGLLRPMKAGLVALQYRYRSTAH